MRYVVYVAGILLMFFVAVGVGAAVALVLSWQPGQVAGDSGGPARSGALEDTRLETTGEGTTLEQTVSKTPGNEVSFVHRAKDENTRENYTYIDNPLINGEPDAIVLAAPTSDRGQTETTTYAHNIGVWYTPGKQEWAIFNQDLAAVPSGATFEVTIPRASEAFVHRATLTNIVSNSTYLDNSLTNGKPDAALSVTQNWNPGGGRGVYNDHAIGVRYDGDEEQWLIYNKDGAPIPEGAAFNVAISAGADQVSAGADQYEPSR